MIVNKATDKGTVYVYREEDSLHTFVNFQEKQLRAKTSSSPIHSPTEMLSSMHWEVCVSCLLYSTIDPFTIITVIMTFCWTKV